MNWRGDCTGFGATNENSVYDVYILAIWELGRVLLWTRKTLWMLGKQTLGYPDVDMYTSYTPLRGPAQAGHEGGAAWKVRGWLVLGNNQTYPKARTRLTPGPAWEHEYFLARVEGVGGGGRRRSFAWGARD